MHRSFARAILILMTSFSLVCAALPRVADGGNDTLLYGTAIDLRNWIRLLDLHTGLDIEVYRAGDINLTNLVTDASGRALFITVQDLRWRLHVLDVVAGTSRVIVETARMDEAAWSPDGERIAYLVGGRHPKIDIIDGRGNWQTTLALPAGWRSAFAWHPDGERIVYWHKTDAGYALFATHLVTRATEPLLSLGEFPMIDQPPRSPPRWLGMNAFLVADHDCNLHEVNLGQMTARQLATRDTCLPHLSPDHTMLMHGSVLVSQQRVRRTVLYLAYRDGREPRTFPRWNLTSADAMAWWHP